MLDDAISTSKTNLHKLYINLTFGFLIYTVHFFIKLNIPKVLFKIKRKNNECSHGCYAGICCAGPGFTATIINSKLCLCLTYLFIIYVLLFNLSFFSLVTHVHLLEQPTNIKI